MALTLRMYHLLVIAYTTSMKMIQSSNFNIACENMSFRRRMIPPSICDHGESSDNDCGMYGACRCCASCGDPWAMVGEALWTPAFNEHILCKWKTVASEVEVRRLWVIYPDETYQQVANIIKASAMAITNDIYNTVCKNHLVCSFRFFVVLPDRPQWRVHGSPHFKSGGEP